MYHEKTESIGIHFHYIYGKRKRWMCQTMNDGSFCYRCDCERAMERWIDVKSCSIGSFVDHHFRGLRWGDFPRNNFISSLALVFIVDPYETNESHHQIHNKSRERMSGEEMEGRRVEKGL